MNYGDSVGRWPFGTAGTTRERTALDDERTTVAFAESAAAATDADPLDLPPLNDRIDPDAVDALLEEFPDERRDGVRAAVEVSWADVSVLIRDDGRIETYPNGREPNRLDPTTERSHDWPGSASLLRSIARTVAAATEGSPADVAESATEWIDADAIETLLRPRPGGVERRDSRLLLSIDGVEVTVTPDGTVAAEPSLTVLKRSGAALLVVGAVPERELDRASATLLGNPDEARSPVFALHGQNPDAARRRLSLAGFSPADGTVLDHRATARSAAAAASAQADDLEVVPVSGDVAALSETLQETFERSGRPSATEVRVGVDSVSSILNSNSLEETAAVFEDLIATVREERGMAHFLLPIDPGSDDVEALVPLFDAVVELRLHDAGVSQRWELLGTGHDLPDFPLE